MPLAPCLLPNLESLRLVGSEANESAIKLAVQFWVDREGLNTKRFNFISRWGSYHGATLGALAASGHRSRRKLFEPLLCDKFQHVSACHPYHDRNERESDDEYNARKAKELDDKIQALGKDTVAAFIAEPVIGAVSGSFHFQTSLISIISLWLVLQRLFLSINEAK